MRTPTAHVMPVLLVVCGAWCQDGQARPEAQAGRQAQVAAPMPDAPSTVVKGTDALSETPRPSHFTDLPGRLTFDEASDRAWTLQSMSPDFDGNVGGQTNTSLDRYLYRLMQKPSSHLPPLTDSRALNKAADPISWILLTRDDSGRRILNTSYLFRRLISAAADTAGQPYWSRSSSTPLDNFSTDVGTDMGLNFFHEFGPGLGQILGAHSPKFVKKLEGRMVRDLTPIESSYRAQRSGP